VQSDAPLHWSGSVANHVLNTALMRITTRVFGVSELTARLPTLLGAALYITACYRFCRRLKGGALLRWSALVSLIYSPFILDYLVAARGYGLALGFFMTAMMADTKKVAGCVLASTAIGLCVASSFSFAFACVAALGALFLRSWHEGCISRTKLLAAYALPAMIVTWLISAPVMFNLPRNEFYYGTTSLPAAFLTLVESQLPGGNPWLYATPGLISLAWLVRIRSKPPPTALFFGGVFLATAALHFAAFHGIGLLYPKERTGIFFVPLMIGAISAATVVPAGWLRRAQIGALLFVAALNFSYLRVDTFKEWNYNADTDRVYSVLTCLHDRHHVDRMAAVWPHWGAMNFYRKKVPVAQFEEIQHEENATPDAEVYVVDSLLTPTVVSSRGLATLWSSQRTWAQIAVPQNQVERLRGSACFEKR
jgi:hypothetical protein